MLFYPGRKGVKATGQHAKKGCPVPLVQMQGWARLAQFPALGHLGQAPCLISSGPDRKSKCSGWGAAQHQALVSSWSFKAAQFLLL